MKISFAANPASIGTINNTYQNSAWRVLWTSGTVERGSSGSPLFDPNKKVVGQLSTSTQPVGPPCNVQTGGTNYGRFDLSWTGGGTNATRLSNWLDPNNTAALTTNTTNVSSLVNFAPTLNITGGTNSICTGSSTYTLTGAPTGTSIAWSLTNTSIASVTPNGTQATVTKTGNGSTVLTAVVGGNCFTNNYVTKTIRIGTYAASEYNITQNPATVYLGNTVQFGMPWYYYPPESGTTYNWNWDGSLDYISGQGTSVVTLGTSRVTQLQKPWVIGKANNSCGSGPMSPAVYLSYYNGASIVITPNPAKNQIFVSSLTTNQTGTEKLSTRNSGSSSLMYGIKIIDRFGVMRKILQYKAGITSTIIPVADLNAGTYIISVFNGKYWSSQKLLIQK